MTPTTYTSLLKDLQRLEKRVTDAHVALARSTPRLAARLAGRHGVSETGGRVEDFVVLCARKSAVQFLLRTVYVRVLEDLGALDPPRIRGERGLAAFRDVAPGLGVRAYLKFVFAELARDFPGLFIAGPDELGELPPEDLCREVWELWHHPNRDGVVYGWAAPEAGMAPEAATEWRFDSRFLGDLYQDLDAEVRKRYALLQTPDFVERYILDHTLTPALKEFGLTPAVGGAQAGGVPAGGVPSARVSETGGAQAGGVPAGGVPSGSVPETGGALSGGEPSGRVPETAGEPAGRVSETGGELSGGEPSGRVPEPGGVPAGRVSETGGEPAPARTIRVLDPTCGSGHFLIGAFRRLADAFEATGLSAREACERALDGVWGCDLNPHAVDIARFRLLLEFIARTGEPVGPGDAERLGALSERLHLTVMDSLVPWEKGGASGEQGDLFDQSGAKDRLSRYATAEERAANAAFLSAGRPEGAGGFHVVVGNPPYITPKDVRKRDDYRAFWPDSAAGKYAMSAPFAERFFDLGVPGAYVGQITANSFMKREFGKRLVERALPRVDLTRVVDTSGAYIPGHGTPTVILFGRNRTPPRNGTIWAVLGKRGEPKRPAVAAQGLVWSAIAAGGEVEDDSSPFVTVAKVEREVFRKHPWSLGGGEAGEIAQTILADHPILGTVGEQFGYTFQTNADPVFLLAPWEQRQLGLPDAVVRGVCVGEAIRDFATDDLNLTISPYDGLELLPPDRLGAMGHALWPWREDLFARATFSGGTYRSDGRAWYQWHQFATAKHRTPLSIAFAFVSTHNHFVLDRGGKVFKQTAPVIKLPATASEDDHLDLLGLLNSSTLGFWMKQAFYDRGNGGIGGGIAAEDWERFYEYDSTKLQSAPLTSRDRPARVALARALDTTARDRAACLPAAVLRAGDFTPDSLPAVLAAARERYRELTHRMVALQEELDWLTYASYGLLDDSDNSDTPIATVATAATVGPDDVEPLAPGHRPFEIRFARLDDDAEPDERSAWWSRHGHDRVTEIPEHYSELHKTRLAERLARIDEDARLQLLETAAFKRRWQTPDLEKEARAAAERWLLDALEDLFAPADSPSPVQHTARARLAAPRPYRLEAIVTEWQRDPRVAAVCGVYSGEGSSVDVSLVAERLLRGHGLPDNPRRVYTIEGLRKRAAWKKTWALQDQEDAAAAAAQTPSGPDVAPAPGKGPTPPAARPPLIDPDTREPLPDNRIPLPPKYDKADFQNSAGDAFSIRGKLDVPRERFIRFDDLRVRAYGWNGWRDRDRAIAQAEAYALAEGDVERPLPEPIPADPRRCGPTLGLWESLGDLKRWGDAATHAELARMAREVCGQPSCPCPVVSAWQAWRDGKVIIAAERDAAEAPVSVTERAKLLAGWPRDMFGAYEPEVALTDLSGPWLAEGGGPDAVNRFERVLDSLVTEGELIIKGRGKARRIRRGQGT